MRRHQQRRRPRRGSAQCVEAGGARGRVSPSDHRGGPSSQANHPQGRGKQPPATSWCSLSGAESPRQQQQQQQQDMARRKSPSRRLSPPPPPRGLLPDAYSSEPEAAGGEGGLMGRLGLAQGYRDEVGTLLQLLPPHKSKARGAATPYHSSKPPGAYTAMATAATSCHPRHLSSAWQHLAPAGEGCPTPCTTTSCTSIYGGELPPGPGEPSGGRRSPGGGGRCARVEELLLRDEPWASPVVPRPPLDYGATDFPTDFSKPPSDCPSSFSFTMMDPKAYATKKEVKQQAKDWAGPLEPCGTSPSLADLMQSLKQYEEEDDYLPEAQHHHHHSRHHHHHRPCRARKGEAQVSLHDLVDKKYEDLIPERDKKIAALMLARHQEEEEMKDRQLQVSDAWEKMRRKEKKHKSRMEKERHRQLADGMEQWQWDRDQRKAKLRLEEQELMAAREREMMLRDKKWKKLSKEQECRRREKCENARLQAEYRKRCQENQLWDRRVNERNTRDQNSYLYKEKMLQALEKKLMKEMERKRRKMDMNEYRRNRHRQAKDQVDDRLKADELYKRLCIEQKLQRSQEILEQLLEERNQELKEKTLKEEEQGMLAKVRAKETEDEKRRRKEMLLQIAEMKIQQAREIMSKNIQDRTQHMKEINCMRERNHHCRKQKLDYDENCHLQDMQEALRRKDQKSNQILRRKDAAIDESRRIAKASYDLREKVRDLINRNSYDQMALDPHRNAGLLRGL